MPEKIERLRRQRGWTQSAFESAAGLPSSRLSKWLMGQGEPTAAQALTIARLFGVSVESLIDEAIETPVVDGLSSEERQILWAAGIVGYETALKRIMAVADVPSPARQTCAELVSSGHSQGAVAVAEGASEDGSGPDLEVESGSSKTLSSRSVPMPRTRRKPPPKDKKGRSKG